MNFEIYYYIQIKCHSIKKLRQKQAQNKIAVLIFKTKTYFHQVRLKLIKHKIQMMVKIELELLVLVEMVSKKLQKIKVK